MLGRRTRVAVPLLLLALLPAIATAAPYEDGDAAFRKKNYTAAMRKWLPLAEAGDARAQLGVARMYHGGLGVVQDYELAFLWFTRAADQNDANAQYILGAMYRDGKGVERDGAKALSLSLKSANQGNPGAQYNLGLMYLAADGANPANHGEAYYWLSLAASVPGKEHTRLRMAAAYARDDAASKLSTEEIAAVKRRIGERAARAR